ncbi:hypothetical protein G7Y79_00072g097890 [Physcia stellaris]|nr:hypothetical protein G7Y79_00072g097890 [Physcia stellaris]
MKWIRTYPSNDCPQNLEILSQDRTPIWDAYTNCVCDFLSSECGLPVRDEARRLSEAAKPCKKHDLCCPSCEPTCHGRPEVEREKPETTSSSRYLLDRLHPIPQNILPPSHAISSKEDKRKLEKEAWQLHSSMIQNLPNNPYSDCICDTLGLDRAYQIVQNQSTCVDYPHRHDCLAHPNLDAQDPHPRHAKKHTAQLASIHRFRKIGRSKGGRKKFTKKAVEELEILCGLQYCGPNRWSYCGCDSDEYLARLCGCGVKDRERTFRIRDDDTCQKCCPRCSPKHHTQAASQDSPRKKHHKRRRTTTGSPLKQGKQRHAMDGQENFPMQYDPNTIASDILRAAGIHPFKPSLNPHLGGVTMLKPASKPKRTKATKRQRKSMPNPSRYKSAEFVVMDSSSEC